MKFKQRDVNSACPLNDTGDRGERPEVIRKFALQFLRKAGGTRGDSYGEPLPEFG
jgi:hypothetical protein